MRAKDATKVENAKADKTYVKVDGKKIPFKIVRSIKKLDGVECVGTVKAGSFSTNLYGYSEDETVTIKAGDTEAKSVIVNEKCKTPSGYIICEDGKALAFDDGNVIAMIILSIIVVALLVVLVLI